MQKWRFAAVYATEKDGHRFKDDSISSLVPYTQTSYPSGFSRNLNTASMRSTS